MSYIVPIHRPSGVRHAIKLNFVSSDEETVVVAKANRLEIYSYSPNEGLVLLHSRTVYGYIIMLESIRPQSSKTDHLFVGTDRYQYFTCSWDATTKQLKTEQSYVDQADKTLRDSRENDRVHIDPTRRFMTLELFDGVVSVIPIVQTSSKRARRDSSAPAPPSPGSLGEPVQVRIEEILTRSSAFLEVDEDSKQNPRLAVLWEDNTENPQLKLRELKYTPGGEQSSAELETVAELRASLDLGVSHLIPVSAPYGGFLVLGERTISYVDSELKDMHAESLDDSATVWTCWTKVDELRWLLADDYGRLFFLMLIIEDSTFVKSWRLDPVGEASKAACLVYLDEGLVFLGSHSGDSQIVRIVEGGVEIVQTFPNIAPILDFELMDLGRGTESSGQSSEFSSGQARIVTASGAWQDATIRSVRSGVGMEELGSIGQIPLITDLWALNSTGSGEHQDTLLVTFVNETRIFKFDAEAGVEEVDDFMHVETTEPTLLAANMPDRKLLQVHNSGLRIADLESGMNVFQWRPSDAEAKVTCACANGAHILVVEGGHTLHVFHTTGADVAPTTSKTFPATSQISGVTVPDSQSNICIVSFWQTASVAILDLHSLETFFTQSLGTPGTDVPRSVLVANVLPAAPPTLFIAMADGTVVTFNLDSAKNILAGMTSILLGSEPVVFKPLPRITESGEQLTNVFASCEQPSLIYASEGRIIYSAVNCERGARVCHFNSEVYPDAVAVASPSELKLATIGTTRTTQLQTLPIGETIRCLAYEPDAKIFGVGCIQRIMEGGEESLKSSVKIADEVSFKELDSFELDENELVESITSIKKPDDDEEEVDSGDSIFVVGTSLAQDDTSMSTMERGRIIVFSVSGKRQKLEVVAKTTVKGACRSLAAADGMIVAGLVKVVMLYRLSPSPERGSKTSHTLTQLASYRTSTDPLSLSIQAATDSKPMTIAVGDLMKSLSIVSVIPPQESDDGNWELREVGRHFATLWTSAVAALAENEWVVADVEGNLAMLRRNPEAYGDEAHRLELTGEMRLGEVVNRIVPIAASGKGQGGSGPTWPELNAKGKGRSDSNATAMSYRQSRTSVSGAAIAGPLIRPQAFVATVEGAIYMLGSINPLFTDALIRLQAGLASRVLAPGYMPWTKYRAWKTEVREADEPFRFVDGEMVEQGFLNLGDEMLGEVLRDSGLGGTSEEGGIGLTLDNLRTWGEELRRLY